METVRTWARWTSTALGASLLVPAAVLIVAAGVAIGGGGLGGIGALGQLIDGPRDPLPAVDVLDIDELARDSAELRPATAGERPGPQPPGAGSRDGDRDAGDDRSSGAAPGDGAPGGQGNGRAGTPDGDGGDGGDTPAPGGGGGAGGGDGARPGGGGGGSGADAPGALDPVEQPADEIVEQLPQPVGPVTGEVIDRVVDLGERLLGRPGGDEGLLGSIDGRP